MAGRLAASIPVVGTLVSVSEGTVKLDLGRQEGVKAGDVVEPYRLGEEYSHPDTGAFLGCDIEELGEAEITKVPADELSEAVFTGDILPRTGDKARLGGEVEIEEPDVVTTTTTTTRPRSKGPGIGITLGAPFLFPINELYGDFEEGATKGLQYGVNLMLDIFLGPFVSLGPYFGLLFYYNEVDTWEFYEEDNFQEILLGLGFKARFVSTGTVRPWLAAYLGYALVYCDFHVWDTDGDWADSFSGGGFGVDGGLGIDFWFSDYFSVGLGGLLHFIGVSEVESDFSGIVKLDNNPFSVGVVLDIGIYF